MKLSFSLVISTIFLVYVGYSMYTFSLIFRKLKCSDETNCFFNFLNRNPKMQLALFSSIQTNPISTEVKKLLSVRNFDYTEPYSKEIKLDVPLKTRRNGTLYMYAVLALDDGKELGWKEFQRDGPVVIQRIHLTKYIIPKDDLYNLLESQKTTPEKAKKKIVDVKPKTHIKTKVFLTVLTEKSSLSPEDVTPELAKMARLTKSREFLPMVQANVLKEKSSYLIEVTKNVTEIDLEFNYTPSSVGKFRLIALIENSLQQLTTLGFTSKDLDEVKEIFADTNLYFLMGTILIGSIHTLFDFLSFKNDVNFWRKKKNYAGLSTRSTVWRAFSSLIIFLYLYDEKSSLLILIPCGIGALIELWKCKRILKIEFTWNGGYRKIETKHDEIAKAEQETLEFDKQGMKYLSFVLYPLVVGYAIYSLIYHPHKSWYSWTLNSTVNGVYAFGFLFMCPQLFINYKLKSVASLPWRAFMYKAFNTFIDDIFAFIITMPTAHRIACFRDDIIFLIYLYQRWLYPVDKTRIDAGASMDDQEEYEAIEQTDKDKKTK